MMIDWSTFTAANWIALAVALLGFLGTVSAALVGGGWIGHRWAHQRGMEDLELRKRTETHKVFFQASTRAHARRETGDGGVGTGEQIAALYVVADMGARDEWLYDAAVNQLDDQVEYFKTSIEESKAAIDGFSHALERMRAGDPNVKVNVGGEEYDSTRTAQLLTSLQREDKTYHRLLAAAEGARSKMEAAPVKRLRGPRRPKNRRRSTR